MLVADDDPRAGRALSRHLVRHGFEVDASAIDRHFADIIALATIARPVRIDAVVCDGLDGCCPVVLEAARNAGIPCVLLTGEPDRYRATAARFGAELIERPGLDAVVAALRGK